MRISAKVRRVGNSLGVVIPSEEAKAYKINEGDVVEIEIQKKVNLQDLFGSLKPRKSSQKAKDEARSDWVMSRDDKKALKEALEEHKTGKTISFDTVRKG
ncbi:MAG: AbrB/MazE/SpoVT family DNA-binding domain-containing protein [Nitrososphaerales archaeon]